MHRQKAVRQQIKPAVSATFFPQANNYLDDLKSSGKFNRYSADKPRIGHFHEFMKHRDLAFSDLAPGLLHKYVVFLKSYHVGRKNMKAMSERTVVNHLAVIRSVFAYARRNKLVTKEQSPFGGDDGIKIVFPDTKKLGLTPEDVIKLKKVNLPDTRHDHARNLWLFSFYFAGMRVSDIFKLKWSDFHEGRLYYIMGKNDKGGSLKVPEKAAAILEKYRQFKKNENDLVFPELNGIDFNNKFEVQKTIAVKNRAINLILRDNVACIAELECVPQMHKARHTFGGLAGDAIPIQMLQKLYRHTHVSTTIGYQESFVHKDADDALDAVIKRAGNSKGPS